MNFHMLQHHISNQCTSLQGIFISVINCVNFPYLKRDERTVSRAVELNDQLEGVLRRHDDLVAGRTMSASNHAIHEEEEEEEAEQLFRRYVYNESYCNQFARMKERSLISEPFYCCTKLLFFLYMPGFVDCLKFIYGFKQDKKRKSLYST